MDQTLNTLGPAEEDASPHKVVEILKRLSQGEEHVNN